MPLQKSFRRGVLAKKSLELITNMKYDYKAVEAKWQKVWEDEKTFHAEIDHKSPSSMPWWSSRILRVQACTWAIPAATPRWTW